MRPNERDLAYTDKLREHSEEISSVFICVHLWPILATAKASHSVETR